MKKEQLEKLFNEHETINLEFMGKCHDCKKEVNVIAQLVTDNDIVIEGGAVYQPNPNEEEFFLKCDDCFQKDSVLRNYKLIDVYSRVVGYMRPVGNWNEAKQQEFKKRQNYKVMEQVFV